MPRRPAQITQADVARAFRAAFAAGATRAQVQVGDILITAEKAPEGNSIVRSCDNEWDALPAGKGAK